MNYVKAVYEFWYDFIIGDDWRIAAGVVLTLVLGYAVANGVARPLGTAVLLAGVLLTIGYALLRSVRGKG